MSARSRRKGKEGELEASRVLATIFEIERPRRQLGQYQESGVDLAPDGTPIVVEVKRRKSLKTLMGWYRQLQQNSRGRSVQILMQREDSGPWLLTLDGPSLVALIYWIQRRYWERKGEQNA